MKAMNSIHKIKIAIIGAGQYGFVVKETAQAMGCFDRIDFLDDTSPSAIDKGSIIEAQAVINSNAQIGIACLICASRQQDPLRRSIQRLKIGVF
ncbi:MAG: hypothetical protein IJ418_23680 [Clostridia bacterium]|nr:hypothetical protein [Clostridia bacterium]